MSSNVLSLAINCVVCFLDYLDRMLYSCSFYIQINAALEHSICCFVHISLNYSPTKKK